MSASTNQADALLIVTQLVNECKKIPYTPL